MNNERLSQRIDMNIELLYDYQVSAVSWLKNTSHGLLDAKTGAGKTLMLLTALAEELIFSGPGSVLILCSKNAIHTWQKEIEKWYPELQQMPMYLYHGLKPAQRRAQWLQDKPAIHICTYATFRNDYDDYVSSKQFLYTILDEAHRGGIRNHKSKTFEKLTTLRKNNTQKMHWTSATIVSKGAEDLYATCYLAAPQKYRSYYGFLNKYCIFVQGPFGRENMGTRDPEKLAEDTAHCIYRIPQVEIDKHRPPFSRQILHATLSSKQQQMYDAFEEEQYLETPETLVIAQNMMSQRVKQRQLLCSPKIIDPSTTDNGSALDLIEDLMHDREDFHTVIFVPYKAAIPIYMQYLRSKLKKHYITYLQGGTSPEVIAKRISEWKRHKGILICVIKFAESFELETAKYTIFSGFEPDQNENMQAEGRLMRATTKHPVTAYYIIHSKTYEETLMQLMKDKFFEATRITKESEKIRNKS